MRLTHWLRSCYSPNRRPVIEKARRKGSWRSPSRIALDIRAAETLEDRTLLATFTVDLLTDENDGNFAGGDLSLREALFLANTDGGADNTEDDTIQFAAGLAGQTILLMATDTDDNKRDLDITDTTGTIIIVGLGADQLTISGNNSARIFHLSAGARLELSGVTIRDGRESSGAGILNEGGHLVLRDSLITANTANSSGGGLRNITGGTMLVERTMVMNNSSGGPGGGLHASGGGTVLISESTFTQNSAEHIGGGIANQNTTGTMTVLNSTVSQNFSEEEGGGIGTFSGSFTTIVHCTIILNHGRADGGGLSALGTEQLVNTIIAGNVRNTGITPDDIQGTVENAFHNLIGNADSSGTMAHGVDGNLVGDAGVGTIDLSAILETTLGDHGGPTLTYALLMDSMAINAGDTARATIDGKIGSTALVTDQRGGDFLRLNGTSVDIGAFEVIAEQNVVLDADDTFAVTLQGDDPGTGYEQLVATGDVTLNDPLLMASRLGGYLPAVGQEFVIVDNQGENPVSGTFVSLSDNSELTINGILFRIDYDGGDGNDVVLTVLAPQTVFVDDDFSALNAGDDPPGSAQVFGFDAFSTVQEAVDQVADDGTVLVSAGMYFGSVMIDKNLTLEGSGPATILDALDGQGLILNDGADLLTIRDLRITNASIGIQDASALTLANLTLSNLLITHSTQGGALDDIAALSITLPSNDDVVHVDDSQVRSTELESIVYRNVSHLVLNGGDGSDVFFAEPISNTNLTINGGGPEAPASTGDALVYAGAGQWIGNTADSGTISQQGFTTLSFSQIESVTMDFVTGTNGNYTLHAAGILGEGDGFLLRLNTEEKIEVVLKDALGTERIAFSQSLAAVNSLTMEGTAGDDVLTVDFLNGCPIPAAGLVFRAHGDGIGDQDVLHLTNGSVASVAHDFMSANSGTIVVEPMEGDVRTITYTGLEPISDSVIAVDRVFNFSAAADQIILSDTENGSRISSTGTSETVDFANPTGTLTLSGGGGDDTFTLLELDSLFAANVIVNGGLGRDTFDLEGTSANANIAYTLNGDQAADIFNIASLEGTGPTVFLNGSSPGLLPGDTLNYDGTALVIPGETGGAGILNPISGAQTMEFSTIETLNVHNPPQLSITDAGITEEAGGPTVLNFTVMLSNGFLEPITVQVGTLSGTATGGVDFTNTNQVLTFSHTDANLDGDNNILTQTFSVMIAPDSVVERDEEFFVLLANAAGAAILDGMAIGTIVDNDSAGISIDDVSNLEDGQLAFTMTLSNRVSEPVTVEVGTAETANGNQTDAISNKDFSPLSGQTLTFSPDGPLTQTVIVLVHDDAIVENAETFEVHLSNLLSGDLDSDVTITDGIAVGTIGNNDIATLSIQDLSQPEGAGPFQFAVTLSNPVSEDLIVRINTLSDTAMASEDFLPITDRFLTFTAGGPLTQIVTSGAMPAPDSDGITIEDDDIVERDERFFVRLDVESFGGHPGDSRVVIAEANGQGTILDNDQATVSIAGDVSALESAGALDFRVLLSKPAQEVVTVLVTTSMTNFGQGTDAVANNDFTATPQIVTFNPGEISKTVSIQVTPDDIVEPDETFLVMISDLRTNGVSDNRIVLGSGTNATATIRNEDSATITIADAAIIEGNVGAAILPFVVTLSAPVQGGVNLSFVAEGITATPGTDFVLPGPLLLAGNLAGETQNLSVTIPGDMLTEGDETFQITLEKVSAQNAAAISVQSPPATGTILNNDSILVTAAGVGGGPHVRVFDQLGNIRLNFFAYDANFLGGVRVATGDLTGDGTPDIVTAPGPGFVSPSVAATVRVFDGTSGLLVAGFDPYPGFQGGIFLAMADLDGDGISDIVTSADAGGGPHVRAFNGADFREMFGFMAYDLAFRGGVRVALGDITGDGTPDVITAPGAGRTPLVRVFDGTSGLPVPGGEFLAYHPLFLGGVFIAAADLTNDDIAEIITGAGAGGGPHVRVFNGTDFRDQWDFMAYDPNFSGGVRVAMGDFSGDGVPDIITAPGEGGGPHIRVFHSRLFYASIPSNPFLIKEFFSFDPGFLGGVFVAAQGSAPLSGSPLKLAGGSFSSAPSLTTLTAADLLPIVSAAATRWEQAGLESHQAATLAKTQFLVRDLEHGDLGLEIDGIILIDDDASGWGWFIDPTPLADEEFQTTMSADLSAMNGDAIGRVDLLTVVLHELGHVLGLDDLRAETEPRHFMAGTLAPGSRRLPDEETLDGLFADSDLMEFLLFAGSP